MPLPISKDQALKAITLMKRNFIDSMNVAVQNSAFSVDDLCGIACQETVTVWIEWIDRKSVDEILQMCVFDASGDYPNTKRSAFPKNTAIFRSKFGDEKTDMLIAEANRSRNARNLDSQQWVYKGYGIFQYDLQNILSDETFFIEKQWYKFSYCIEKVLGELNIKWEIYKDHFKSIKAYNGSGTAAQEYANNVIIFSNYSKEVQI
jgi:hypothetical protein